MVVVVFSSECIMYLSVVLILDHSARAQLAHYSSSTFDYDS